MLLFCPSWSCTITYCIIKFTSLHYARTFHLLKFLAEAFQCHVHHFQCLTVPVELAQVPLGLSSIENDAHSIKKLLLKIQVSEKFLHSEVNLIIQYNIGNVVTYWSRIRFSALPWEFSLVDNYYMVCTDWVFVCFNVFFCLWSIYEW